MIFPDIERKGIKILYCSGFGKHSEAILQATKKKKKVTMKSAVYQIANSILKAYSKIGVAKDKLVTF